MIEVWTGYGHAVQYRQAGTTEPVQTAANATWTRLTIDGPYEVKAYVVWWPIKLLTADVKMREVQP